MMRKNGVRRASRIVLGIGLLCQPEATWADSMKQVVMYPDRAQVTKTTQVRCEDTVRVHFFRLPPSADPTSLRASVEESGVQVLGVRTETEVQTVAFSKEAEALQTELRRLGNELALIEEERTRDRAKEMVAVRYEDVAASLLGREFVTPLATAKPGTLGVKAWSSAIDMPLKVRMTAAEKVAAREKTVRALRRAQQEASDKLRLLSAGRETKQVHAEVLLSCGKHRGQNVSVDLLYWVGGASYHMEHEARLLDGGTVELTSYALLSQQTGEPWPKVQVMVSTAVPKQNATPPDIQPLHVNAAERKPPKKLIVSRVEEIRHKSERVANLKTTGGLSSRDDVGGAERTDQGLSVQFAAKGVWDVPGNGTKVRILLKRTELAAKVVYRTLPKLLPQVFRVADLVNATQAPLLEGPIDVFHRGQYVARYNVPFVGAGERFELSFGLLDRVKVRRKVLAEVSRDAGSWGSTRRMNYAYRFELENYLPQTDEIELLEHIPVSELDDVKVAIDQKTTPGYVLSQEEGIVRYKLRLSPSEKRAIELHYFIEAPQNMLGE